MAEDRRPGRTEADIIARLHTIREEVQKLRDDLRSPAKFSGRGAGPLDEAEPFPTASTPPRRRQKPSGRARKKR